MKLYYKYQYNFGPIRIFSINLDRISQEKIFNYIEYITKEIIYIGSVVKYDLINNVNIHDVNAEYFEYDFIQPSVLFRNNKFDYNIVNIFGYDLKYILYNWKNITKYDSEYYQKILNTYDDFESIINNAIIKSIIE